MDERDFRAEISEIQFEINYLVDILQAAAVQLLPDCVMFLIFFSPDVPLRDAERGRT